MKTEETDREFNRPKEIDSEFARAIECLHEKINSEESFIFSIQSINGNERGDLDINLTVTVNLDTLPEYFNREPAAT